MYVPWKGSNKQINRYGTEQSPNEPTQYMQNNLAVLQIMAMNNSICFHTLTKVVKYPDDDLRIPYTHDDITSSITHAKQWHTPHCI